MRNYLADKISAEQRNLVIGYALVLPGSLGFSAKAIIIKLAYAANGEVDAITLMALRMLFALLFFCLLLTGTTEKQPPYPRIKNNGG